VAGKFVRIQSRKSDGFTSAVAARHVDLLRASAGTIGLEYDIVRSGARS
jgi:hypothetical protein